MEPKARMIRCKGLIARPKKAMVVEKSSQYE
jgi:hypothetical protein